MRLKYEASWRAGDEYPPFVADKAPAVEFLKAVLDSAVGTQVSHSFRLSAAVAVQRQLLLSAKDAATRRAFTQLLHDMLRIVLHENPM
eukprot:3210649-Pleurochrysis_carterae.AAC.5